RTGQRAVWTGKRLKTSGNHDLEIPLSQDRVGVFPVEDFALLSDSNLAKKISRRLREDGVMSRSATSSDGATPPMKQAQLHILPTCSFVQGVMRLVQFPRTGQPAAVFVGIGVADHDFLPACPGIQQLSIRRIAPDALHIGGRITQRLN